MPDDVDQRITTEPRPAPRPVPPAADNPGRITQVVILCAVGGSAVAVIATGLWWYLITPDPPPRPADTWGEAVTVRKFTVHFARGAPRESAEKLARYLAPPVDDGKERLARIQRPNGQWMVDLFAPRTRITEKEDFAAECVQIRDGIREAVLNGETVTLRICNPLIFIDGDGIRREPSAWKEVGP